MKQKTIAVTLRGIRPIMFDRYPGSLKAVDALPPEEKIYVHEGNIVLPSKNIMSFLSSQNNESATQRVMGRGWKAIAKAAMSFVSIDPYYINFTRDGEILTPGNADIRIHHDVARVKKGALTIPSQKERPVIDTPWELSFTIDIYENSDISETVLRRIFEDGGITVGLGTYRGMYGKFEVDNWGRVHEG